MTYRKLKRYTLISRYIITFPNHYIRGNTMHQTLMNHALNYESNPLTLRSTIALYGTRYAYWKLRDMGASRYAAIRSIFFAKGVK